MNLDSILLYFKILQQFSNFKNKYTCISSYIYRKKDIEKIEREISLIEY